MTLRSTLLGLVGVLALSLLAAAGWLTFDATRADVALRRDVAAAQERTILLDLLAALDAESLVLVDIRTDTPGPPLHGAVAVTDAALALATTALAHNDESGEARLILHEIARALPRRRKAAAAPRTDGVIAPPDGQSSLLPPFPALERIAFAPPAKAAQPDLLRHTLASLRLTLRRGIHSLVRNRLQIEARISDMAQDARATKTAPAAAFAASQRDATAALAGQTASAGDAAKMLPEAVAVPLHLALTQFETMYRPAETRLLEALAAPAPDPRLLLHWREASSRVIDALEEADTALATEAAFRVGRDLAASRARFAALAVASCLAAGLAILALRLAATRILDPLVALGSRLAQLARDEFTAPPAATPALSDVAAMHAALDLLCLEGERRIRMQAELARLGDRVVRANRQMTADLEAAARVQRAQLPVAPLAFASGTFHAFFRPCRVVAGDTYDCLAMPDGRLRLFQIDVSGHGAPAALVSIASHIALKQALLSAPPTEPLADIIARTNRDWAEDLPYFTLLAVEIDPATATASIVQCGHPALIRLPANGGAETLGSGGLPIGVLPDADFVTLTCPFRSGDRLVIATDGVTETADPDTRMFGDDRFRDLLTFRPHEPVQRLFDRIERALWDWRGSEILDDDITILVLEAA